MLKRVLRSAAVQALTARIVSLYLAFAFRTTRWRIEGVEHLDGAIRGEPTIAACWHECLPLAPVIWLHARRHGATGTPRILASKHRDGRFIGAVMRPFGVAVVHGSSAKNNSARDVTEKGGIASTRILLAQLEAGEHVVITPDGPRGPRRVAAPGVAQLAKLSGCPVLPVGAQTTRRRILPTWDRMIIPLPFGRGVIVLATPITVLREDWEAALPAIAAAMTAAADRAEALCRA